ncbi:MAG TPA: hypothetical protein DGB72_02905 [Gemmatimonadetes bacterium]|nr:hypothetical protein [Gemmatimonadota bacterium]
MSRVSGLARYALWQFRDFVFERGVAILIISFLWGYALIAPLRGAMGSQMGRASPIWPLMLQGASTLVSLSVLIALNGIISSDRKLGYYRFLFSKPVNPVLYYAQAFFVGLIGVVLSMLVLSSLMHTILPIFSIVNFLLYTALIYIAMGGIGFFVSAATRFDWVSLAVVWLGSRILRSLYGPKGDWRSKAVELLPPVHKLDEVANSLIGTGTAHATDVLWLLGYGALFFVLGLVLLRWGSLAD